MVVAAAYGTTNAFAGIGLAVVLDLPSEIRAGAGDLDGSVTLFNMNTEADQLSQNLAFAIAVTPSCGEHALSGECPVGAEDPGVFAIGPVATGREGTACAGTVFTVKQRNAATGEVLFDTADEIVVLGSATDAPSARQCTIDFTFSYVATPRSGSAGPGKVGIETTAYVQAQAISVMGLRSGIAGNMTKLVVR